MNIAIKTNFNNYSRLQPDSSRQRMGLTNTLRDTDCRLIQQPKHDVISFTSFKKVNNIAVEVLTSSSKRKIFDALMQINNEDGPLVENMTKYFCKKNAQCDEQFIKKSVSNAYREQAKMIAKVASQNKNTKIITAVDKTSNKIVGVSVLLPIGHANKQDVVIYELCNLGVSQSHQKQGIGTMLCKNRLPLAKKKKIIVFFESINPTFRNFYDLNNFKPNTKNSPSLLEAMDIKYSPDWFLFKEYNMGNETINDIKVKPYILKAWNKGWADWAKYD